MKTKVRSVAVRKLPERISGAHRDQVYRDLESAISVDRPAVVLDCSALRELDPSAIHLLLCCLEEAMKRNGDVRLAAVAPQAQASLEAAEVDTLFQQYEHIGDAVESFHRPQFDFIQFDNPLQGEQKSRMNAA
ncbi:STAS domain-containing protein [Occallatibacter savannae]|uniref:STAS domain-containing protein n=1 Tax=Occallatibacter savannae TaxID=1002691 RepID=UPI000D696BA6|nr:STAS domain-containing protein [Occallatibacter savannae]